MWDKMLECVEKFQAEFGEQLCVIVKRIPETGMDVTLMLFLESEAGTRQLQVDSQFGYDMPDADEWCTGVIEAMLEQVTQVAQTILAEKGEHNGH